MRIYLVWTLLCCCAGSLFAQSDPECLPRHLSDAEKLLLQQGYTVPGPGPASITTPPGLPARSMAEWEELQGLVITWTSSYVGIQTEIVRNASLETDVIIACSDSNSVKNTLTNASVALDRVRFLQAPYNTVWVRDFGPNPVYLNQVDSLVLVDWIYNRPRPKDDTLSTSIARMLDIPLFQTKQAPTDLVHTGGNFMSDGLGRAFSSNLVLDENGPDNTFGSSNHSAEEVDQIMHDYMGINEYIKMTVLPYDAIHHIDMHMKLLDEETLLVGQYPQGVADGPQIEANIQYVLSQFKTSFGRDFKVIRIPMPPQGGAYPNTGADYRTYANAVFVNKTVLVPIYEQKYDTTALRIWREALPGYKIVGINCNAIIPASGAIHCITKEIGVSDPLWISHAAWSGVVDRQDEGYEVVAQVRHRSGIAGATLYYTTDLSAGFQSVTMSEIDPAAATWGATIPYPGQGVRIYYYIHGEANSGKTANRPMPAPEGYYTFITAQETAIAELSATLQPIFPNPASAITCIPVDLPQGLRIELSLRDINGRLLQSIYSGQQAAGSKNYFIDAANLSTGVYLVELRSGKQVQVQKLVVY